MYVRYILQNAVHDLEDASKNAKNPILVYTWSQLDFEYLCLSRFDIIISLVLAACPESVILALFS